ncbi:MAG: response regulator transcription factor [Opitutaceae bacterium]|nr:response regulator transcription factor [Opitutaceae bacterium]
MKRKVRILLVEDNPHYRDVIALALHHERDFQVCGQFGTAEIALRTLRDTAPADLPDLVMLDLRLPGLDGLETLPRFLSAAPGTKVIILTQSDNEADVLRAISCGASGYLLKSSTAGQIVEGIRNVLAGGASLDAGVARYLLNALKTRLPRAESEVILTTRQREILNLLGEGLVKKEIADRLGIGYATVDDHIANIYLRLGVRNAPAAVNKAHLLGLFSPPEKPTNRRDH